MPAPSTLTAFKDAGWRLERRGYNRESATASNGEVEVSFDELTNDLRTLEFSAPDHSFSMHFGITVTPLLPQAIDLIIAAQPDLDWDSYRLLVRDLVRLGVPVTAQIDGESVPVTDTPDTPAPHGLRGLLHRMRNRPIDPRRFQ
ncbi:hypothetical protein AAEX63_08640 [Luteococcus sp. H138]|uniref:hypothetical protein n=1 Tax=unclassified Luteococcus TaxID=2639923 RepID=UPI00313C8A39